MTDFIINEITSMEDIAQMEHAKIVGEILNEKYPGHMWLVSWQGGGLVVKNLAISSHYGFLLRDDSDARVLRDNAIKAGGELLERAAMVRGKWDGRFAEVLEGSDPRFFKPTRH